MTRFISIIAAVVGVFFSTITLNAGRPSAATVMKKSSELMKNAPSITVKFSLSEGADISTGTLRLSGDKFVATLDGGITTWYDGTTQWVYNPKVNEMTVSAPTPDELATINPFVIVSSLQKSYTSKHLKAPADRYIIELTPVSKSADIKKVVITVDSKYIPIQAAITLSNGHTASIKVKTITKGGKLAQNYFRPDKNKYRSAEWIDMR